jgi:quercetin dioxygenase-like cupin family protein
MNQVVNPLPRELTPEKIEQVESCMLKEEQVDCPVTHKFGPGIYIREVFLPAGSYVVGHHHNHEHMNIMLTGRIKFFGSGDEWTELKAPQTFVAPAGRKVAFVHEDTIWQNIYSTDEKDPDKLEKELLTTSMTFQDAQKYNKLQLTYDRVEDFKDYYIFLKEFGLKHEALKEESKDETTQIPFPYGEYKVQVKDSQIEGKGLFATANFEEGDVIAPARIDSMRTPAGRYINHSKKPNSFFVRDEQNNVFAVAGRDIIGYRGGVIGEEITVDYRQAMRLSEKD